MQVIRKVITLSEYEELKKLSSGALSAFVRKSLSESIIIGYGYYGANLAVKDDKYYIEINIGDSCD